MSEHVQKTITDLQAKLRSQEEAVALTKRMINDLRQLVGQSPLYADATAESRAAAGTLRSDQFYGRALSTAVREYLEMRRVANVGPASVSEIYDALIEGGYKFDAKSAENAKRSLRISLTKNSVTFHRLPNGEYGLLEWYPNAKRPRDSAGEAEKAAESDTEEEGDE